MSALRQLAEYDRLQLEQRWPNPHRLALAFRLAPNVETCEDLLSGVGAGPEQLDASALLEARQRMLVRLVPALDVLEGIAA